MDLRNTLETCTQTLRKVGTYEVRKKLEKGVGNDEVEELVGFKWSEDLLREGQVDQRG